MSVLFNPDDVSMIKVAHRAIKKNLMTLAARQIKATSRSSRRLQNS